MVKDKRESILATMRRVCSAYRKNSKQYLKARDNLLNEYERSVYCKLLNTIRDFYPDEDWKYIHHENLDLYKSREHAIDHLYRAWGGGVDYKNYKIVGKEAYFKAK